MASVAAAVAAPPPEGYHTVSLPPRHELRVEVEKGSSFSFKMAAVRGGQMPGPSAEVFGAEVSPSGEHVIEGPAKFAIFSWYGCSLYIKDVVEGTDEYVADNASMPVYASIHARLEHKRNEETAGGGEGPRILVTGPVDVGKSTLVQLLLTWAVRCGRFPVWVDTDVGQNSLSVPGTIGAAVVSARDVSVEAGLTASQPYVIWHGDTSPGSNGALYDRNVSALARVVDERTARDARTRASGVIVNTCGWVDGGGYKHLKHIIKAFSIELVIVLGSDKTYAKLKGDASSLQGPRQRSPVMVVKLKKSGGVVGRNQSHRRLARSHAVHRYFYGAPGTHFMSSSLAPTLLSVSFDDVSVVTVGGGGQVTENLVAAGQRPASNPCRVEKAVVTKAIENTVAAVVYCKSQAKVVGAAVAGYVVIKEVDLDASVLRLLAPSSSQLPGKFLVLGNVKWLE